MSMRSTGAFLAIGIQAIAFFDRRKRQWGDGAMSPLIWLIILALQNGTQDPVVNREFVLSIAPNVCAKREETLGSIEFYKTCGNENLSVSVAPGRADQVIVKVFYWN